MSCVARPFTKQEYPQDYWQDHNINVFQQQRMAPFPTISNFFPEQYHIDQLFNAELNHYYAAASGDASSEYSPQSSPYSSSGFSSPSIEEDYKPWESNFIAPHPQEFYQEGPYFRPIEPSPLTAQYEVPAQSYTSAFTEVKNPMAAFVATEYKAPVQSSPSPVHSDSDNDLSKQRISWTQELHSAFLRAYDTLGDEATPKKIMFIMRAQGVCMKSITRLKVASHLQRHEKKLGLARRPSVTKKLMSGQPTEANTSA